MDTRKRNIRMCEKAEEIQKLWEITEGDWYIDYITFPNDRILEVLGGHPNWDDDVEGREKYYEHQRRSIWLPTQSQLQKIYLKSLPEDEQESHNIAIVILDDFQDWVLNKCDGLDWAFKAKDPPPSMEELWVCFVMKECYKKYWIGENWEVIKEF